MARDFEGRAAANSKTGNEVISARVAALIAEYSAKGLPKRGATAKRSLEIFEEETAKFLQQTLDEAAKLVEHRGRAWMVTLYQPALIMTYGPICIVRWS